MIKTNCSQLVEELDVENQYQFNGNQMGYFSKWINLKGLSDVRIRTRKISTNKKIWTLKLIEGTEKSSSTWKECNNLALDFYKTQNTKIIVSYIFEKKICSHSSSFSARLEYNNNAFMQILESKPKRNDDEKTDNDEQTVSTPEKKDLLARGRRLNWTMAW